MKILTHTDQHGNAVMVDVSGKNKTFRKAEAYAEVHLSKEVFKLLIKNKIAKGDVFTTAKIAGIQAAKKTSELIPLCHNVPIDKIDINFIPVPEKNIVKINSLAVTEYKTGVEMEAMTAVSAAALTIYDMCKGADKSIIITQIKLLSKSGGKSGNYKR